MRQWALERMRYSQEDKRASEQTVEPGEEEVQVEVVVGIG